jgi:hypothetical protein
MAEQNRKLGKEILLTGLLAGTLDITGATLNYIIPTYRDPANILKFIASGVLGSMTAFTSGWWPAALGLFLHYFIATSWTAIFYLGYDRIMKLAPNKILAGIVYGCFVWLFMSRVVVPLSRTPKFPFNPTQAMIGVGIIIVAIGLPISIRASKYFAKK